MDYAILTEKADREINEDTVKVVQCDGSSCFVVADGLGGHGRGEEASELVANCIADYFQRTDHTVRCIAPAIECAQQLLLDAQKKQAAYFEMKTTVVVLVVEQNGTAQWGYVGDSRLYLLRKHKIKLQTQDHSVPQMLVTAGDIRAKDIRFHPDRNKLLRVMGVQWQRPMYEVSKPIRLKKNQSFLLCSDGFWEWIDEQKISACRKKSETAQEWLDRMGEIVVRNGAQSNTETDNRSAVTVIWS